MQQQPYYPPYMPMFSPYPPYHIPTEYSDSEEESPKRKKKKRDLRTYSDKKK